MAAFVKFECFSEDLAKKVHNLHTDQVNAFLSNAAPNVATHTAYDGVTGATGPAEIANGNGYTTLGADTTNTVSRSGATSSVLGVDIVWTATGAVGPFRYVVLFNNTSAGKQLIGYWDYGASGVTLANTETFTADFGASMFTIA